MDILESWLANSPELFFNIGVICPNILQVTYIITIYILK